MMILGDWYRQRGALLFPVRDQLVERERIDDRARKDVRANLAPLLEDTDRKIAPGLVRKLFQPDRGAKASGARTDDDDVISHGFAFAHRPLSGSSFASRR